MSNIAILLCIAHLYAMERVIEMAELENSGERKEKKY